jgi:hypothetical protein
VEPQLERVLLETSAIRIKEMPATNRTSNVFLEVCLTLYTVTFDAKTAEKRPLNISVLMTPPDPDELFVFLENPDAWLVSLIILMRRLHGRTTRHSSTERLLSIVVSTGQFVEMSVEQFA